MVSKKTRGAGSDGGRVAGDLAQHGCSMTGFAFQVSQMTGELSVVVFGERDCANAFPRYKARFSSDLVWNVFTAAVREQDVMAGTAESRLADCLRLVAKPRLNELRQIRPPRGILVLSTCLSEMIGADPGQVCREVEAETGVRIIPIATSGLRLRTQAEIADWVARILVTEFGTSDAPDPTSVNLIGYATDRAPHHSYTSRVFRAEISRVLEMIGLHLNATVPTGATLDDWVKLPSGGLSLVVDKAIFGDLLGLLDRPGHRAVEMEQPHGIARMDAFYRDLAREAGRDLGDRLEALPERVEALESLKDAQRRYGGKRLAYGIGSHHNFRPDQLAMEGLGLLPMFVEMGFDIEILIQERDQPEVHKRIRRNLEALGVDVPYHVFNEPAVLAPVLAEGRFDLAYVADFLAGQVSKVGIPMVPMGRLMPGYWGVTHACGVITRATGAVFDQRYSKYR
jgi:nitrogenase molybdenum-iron protein alpha/beta subunit